MPSSSAPFPTPRSPGCLLNDQQLREWWASLFGSDVLPCRQTIRSMRAIGLPHAKIHGTYLYDPGRVWQWIQGQMVSENSQQRAMDAARAHLEAQSRKTRSRRI